MGSSMINDMEAVKTVDDTITERGGRYGKFSDGAEIMQDLKGIMHDTPNVKRSK